MLGRQIAAPVMFSVGTLSIITDRSAVVCMFRLFCYESLVGWPVQTVTATPEFINRMLLEIQFGVRTDTQVAPRSQGGRIKSGNIRKAVRISIISIS